MAPTHKSKSQSKSKPRRKPLPTAPKGPSHTYTISQPWTASNSGYSIGRNRKRIHSIRRKLQYQSGEKNLPGHVRVALERELKSLRREEAVGKAELLRQDNMRRFKRINFFDNQKTKRKLKKARRALETAKEDEKDTLEKLVRVADVDYHYASYYPLGTPYVPLFPRKEGRQSDGGSDEGDEENSIRGDVEMRQRIEKAMEEGKPALQRLRNELIVEEAVDEGISVPNEKGAGEDDNADDDGDFFE